MSEAPFSRRHGLYGLPLGTLIRDDAPYSVRTGLAEVLSSLKLSSLGNDFDGIKLRNLLCQVMNIKPNLANWNGYLAFGEAQRLIYECEWFQFYEIVEELAQLLRQHDPQRSTHFANKMNETFTKRGIGWQVVNCRVVIRGDEAFENTVKTAMDVLGQDNKPTAAAHLQFAIDALSSRPKANSCAAVSHATNAIECVLGEITGQATTLGKYLDKYASLFHPALKKGLDGIYGYASDAGARHGKEGSEPAREDAEFAVAVCAAVCTLLTRKHAQ